MSLWVCDTDMVKQFNRTLWKTYFSAKHTVLLLSFVGTESDPSKYSWNTFMEGFWAMHLACTGGLELGALSFSTLTGSGAAPVPKDAVTLPQHIPFLSAARCFLVAVCPSACIGIHKWPSQQSTQKGFSQCFIYHHYPNSYLCSIL